MPSKSTATGKVRPDEPGAQDVEAGGQAPSMEGLGKLLQAAFTGSGGGVGAVSGGETSPAADEREALYERLIVQLLHDKITLRSRLRHANEGLEQAHRDLKALHRDNVALAQQIQEMDIGTTQEALHPGELSPAEAHGDT